MISKRKAGLVLIVVFTLMVNFTVDAFDQDMTRHIENTDQDVFVLETGVAINADFMTVLSPDMDIRGMLFFEDIKVNNWHSIYNATLRLRTFHARSFEAESTITIYGVLDYGGFGYSEGGIEAPRSPSAILNLPLTRASVNYNTSQFYGTSWKEIDVTVLVNEMKNHRHYDGPGSDPADLGDNMIFMIFGAEGYEPRSFYDFKAGNNLEAQLVIHWTDSPAPPAGGYTFNESQRGLNIWFIDHNGENRTGEASDVNWNLLNVSDLTENDAAAYLTVQNDTWVTVNGLQAQFTATLYNDTGAADIQSFFVRFAVNVSAVTSTIAGSESVGSIAGISTANPTGGGGLADGSVGGSAGDWAGVIIMSNQADTHFLIRLQERSGAGRVFGGNTGWIDEDAHDIIYGEFQLYDVGVQNWISFRLFSDSAFTQPLSAGYQLHVLTVASEPFRYPQVTSGMGAVGGTSSLGHMEFYSFLEMPLAENKTWVVAYENGTIIDDDCPTYQCALVTIDNLLGTDPQEPEPPGQGWDPSGPFSRFSTRLYILLIGVGLIFGPLVVFALNRPSGYEFTIGVFIMVVGFALMYAAGQV